MKVSFLSLAVLLMAGHAQAQFARIRCETQSRAQVFSAQGNIESVTRQLTVDKCRANGSTVNSECDQNVWCEDTLNPSPEVRCETQSRAQSFAGQSRNERAARTEAIARCQANASTVNTECSNNVSCFDPNRRETMICETFSRGAIFEATHAVASFARTEAVARCQANASTVNSECTNNVTCVSKFDRRSDIRCETTSRGAVFSANHQNRSYALSLAISRCQANGSTVNSECERNAACTDGDIRPEPRPFPRPEPRPRPEEPRRNEPPVVRGDRCFVKQTNQWVEGEAFFNLVSNWTQRNHRCAVAKIANVPMSGRIYRADGSRVDRDRGGLSNRDVEQSLRSNNLFNCELFSCDERN